MNHKNSFTSSHFLVLLCFALLLLDKIPLSGSFDGYTTCSNKYRCGIIEADFPFWGDGRPEGCGYPGLELNCKKKNATIEIKGVKYQVLEVDPKGQIFKIARTDYMNGICSPKYGNTSLDLELFEYAPGSGDITFFYGCSSETNTYMGGFNCSNEKGFIVPGSNGSAGSGLVCRSRVTTRVPDPVHNYGEVGNVSVIEKALGEGFRVKYKADFEACERCKKSNGVCGYDRRVNEATCYCRNGPSLELKPCTLTPGAGDESETPDDKTGGDSNKTPKVVGISIAGACILGMLGGGFAYYFLILRKKKRAALVQSKDLPTPPSSKSILTSSMIFSGSTPSGSYSFSKSDLEKGSNYFGAQVFSYTELEEATENFDPSRELGGGGFGTVYYGELRDGRVVAVKRLHENNYKRAEQFKNEVEILSRLEHKNLVKLYGCTSRRSRELLLVYEFIPNGTVADHLHGKQSNSRVLSWPIRLSIAIETADALAYLHCSDIIHRDVKTNNILLDNEFRVKVADFGLSRLFPNDVTHVSTAPQGTPGYVDPEYYQCYQLTDKSDVYSFGVVLIELISSLQAVDTDRHRHDINLANMAITRIQNHAVNELVDPCLGFETDYNIKRMTTAVAELAFRCLQPQRDMRPSMDEVLATLKAIRNQEYVTQKAEVVDIRSDNVGLLKNLSPPLSPDSVVNDKWVSSSTTPSSH